MRPSEVDRRTLAELRTLYDVEPDIQDVVVEGRRDRDLVRWYLREVGLRKPQVYAVDDRVEIDAVHVHAASAEVGARGRVVALAAEASTWNLHPSCLACVVDADRDCVEPAAAYPDLLVTDYGSMDVYLFQEAPLARLLELVLGTTYPAARLIEELVPPLVEVFLVRAALHCVDVALIDAFPACCKLAGGKVEVDHLELIRRSLARAGRAAEFATVVDVVDLYRSRVPAELRRAIRGHDLAPMIIWHLRLRNDWAKPQVVEQAWRGCLRPEDLHELPFFMGLRARLMR